MGKRTHLKKIPPDAIDYYGKPWTRLMIIKYAGITPHKYKEFVKDREPVKLLEWGAWVYHEKRRRILQDKSRTIECSGVALTVMQWFYLAIKQELFTKIEYSAFQHRISYYKNRQNLSKHNDSSALQDTLRSMGVENIVGLAVRNKNNKAFMDKLNNEYLDVINAYHQGIKDDGRDYLTEKPPFANDRWFECLLADTRLHWLFYEEYEKEMGILQQKLANYEQAQLALSNELAYVKHKLTQTEKQLADIGRSKASCERTTT